MSAATPTKPAASDAAATGSAVDAKQPSATPAAAGGATAAGAAAPATMLRCGRQVPVPGPGQESVWDYPRPPALQDVKQRVRVVFNGVCIADTTAAKRVCETSHPPTYYLPPECIAKEYFELAATNASYCEWKGSCSYYTISVKGKRAVRAAWFYPEPTEGTVFAANGKGGGLAGYVAFYAAHMDACYVGDEQVTPQPGAFYGGWVTKNLTGPFKGAPGTMGW